VHTVVPAVRIGKEVCVGQLEDFVLQDFRPIVGVEFAACGVV